MKKNRLIKDKILTENENKKLIDTYLNEIDEAFKFADQDSFPEPETAEKFVYEFSRNITLSDALCEATHQAMNENKNVFVIGEGVTDPKAIFGTTFDLVTKFGLDRVIEAPLAENGLTGFCIGSAMSGMKPLLIHQRVEFALLSVEQIFNNAAKTHYVSAGKALSSSSY